MSFPIAPATKVNLDSSGDDPSQARAELVSLVDKVNELLALLSQTPGASQIPVLSAGNQIYLSGTGTVSVARDAGGYMVRTSTGASKSVVRRALDNKLIIGDDVDADVYTNGLAKFWHASNDGTGSGLDADLLDGKHASAFPLGGESNLRIVRGSVNSAGTITQGSGFTVSKSATGSYSITFSPAFSGTPTVTATSSTFAIATALPGSASAATVFTSTGVSGGSGTAYDAGFNFIAIGPN